MEKYYAALQWQCELEGWEGRALESLFPLDMLPRKRC